MNAYKTVWTGKYPNLCCGEWQLYINDELNNIEIPFQYHPANTEGIYEEWYFNDDYDEEWDSYTHGMNCADWCDTYKNYLKQIAPESDWPMIFKAFQENDWRHGQCGGCI